MEYVISIVLFILVLFIIKTLSFRAKSINAAIEALKKSISTLPNDSTPSPNVMKSKLANKYYDLSHRVQTNDIRDYAKKTISIQNPTPSHVAMLLLKSLSYDFKQEGVSINLAALVDISCWCDAAYEYLVEQERN